MSFDPERWLQVADVCCIQIPKVDSEALLRTALGRAYYAALLSVARRIEAAQGPGAVPSAGTHEAILQALATGGRDFAEIRRTLLRLREGRNEADYNLRKETLARHEVVSRIDLSRKLIRTRINALRDDEYRRLKVPPR